MQDPGPNSANIVVPIVVLIVLAIVVRYVLRVQRRKHLMKKYGDQQCVDAIMARKFWVGMTLPMLLDSIGRPVDVDTKIYKTKSAYVYKYSRDSKNRYRTRIRLENDVVLGIETR